MTNSTDDLLRAILNMLGRSAFSMDEISTIVGKSLKNRKAYNLCDGTSTQSEIVKKVKTDAANFSKAVARWVAAGIMFKVGDGKDVKLLHIFPLAD